MGDLFYIMVTRGVFFPFCGEKWMPYSIKANNMI